MLFESSRLFCFCLFKANLVISYKLVLQCPHLILCLDNDLRAVETKLLLVQKLVDFSSIEVLSCLRTRLWKAMPSEKLCIVCNSLSEAVLQVQSQKFRFCLFISNTQLIFLVLLCCLLFWLFDTTQVFLLTKDWLLQASDISGHLN